MLILMAVLFHNIFKSLWQLDTVDSKWISLVCDTVQPELCIPTFCVFQDFTYFLYRSGQMSMKTIISGFFTILGCPYKNVKSGFYCILWSLPTYTKISKKSTEETVNELADHTGLFKMSIISYKINSRYIYANLNTNSEYKTGT